MKTRFLLLALLLISAASIAQTAFTKATMESILKDYHKNSHDFFKSYCSPDFRYIAPDGSFVFLPELLKASVNDKVGASEILDQQIIQSGNVAVVSGIHLQERRAADGTKNTRRVASTYTFQQQRGKSSAAQWKFVASQQSNVVNTSPSQTSADEKAIKTVVEQESVAFHQRKADKALSYWANVPYASHSYTEKGSGYLRGYGTVSKAIRKYIGEHPDVGKSSHKPHDFRIHVNGNSALATFITDGLTGTKKSQSYDARYLEKINGVWKLVSVFGTPAP